MQLFARRGLAEVGVDGLLGLGQRAAQLLHHTAHRLPIRDAAVELLHPRFERFRLGTALHVDHALGQAAHPIGLRRMVELAVVERGLEVEHRGGDFHRQGGRRRDAGGHRLAGHRGKRLCQLVAAWVELLQRLADQLNLFVERGQAVQFGAGHRGPALLGCRDPLLGLGDGGRIEATELGGEVVHRRAAREFPGQAHGGQARRAAAGAGRRGLGAEEEQVLRQAL